jgi:hypothetical protein
VHFNPGLIFILDQKIGGGQGVILAPQVTFKLNIFWLSKEKNLMEKNRN